MLAPQRAVSRFSLLLLEEGEEYVADWVAECTGWPAAVSGNWAGASALPGRLRLASKSLFFEADDVRVPVVRLPWAQVEQLEAVGKRGIAVATSMVTKMKAHCMDAPYVTVKGPVTMWTFALAYAPMEDFMPLAQEQLAASRLPYPERDEALQAAADRRADSARFDMSRLAEFSEKTLVSIAAHLQTPLVRETGTLVVTDARIYFQPLHDIAGDAPVRSHPLAAVAAVVRRRSSLRPLGIELFFIDPPAGSDGWGSSSAFFAFRSEATRESVLAAMTHAPALGAALPGGAAIAAACASILQAEGAWLGRVVAAWQAGRVSNLDFLLYLNLAAGRSFNDLTQWPVFPWVLADYTSPTLDLSNPKSFRDLSKPVGATNPDRLEMLRQRMAEMPREPGWDPPFLYGSHYSCPGFVMFWLVRAAPGHLLRLQNGRFDAPDRLFSGVREAWESVTGGAADFKELIPEFFLPGGGAFLVNRRKLALGTRQDGRRVDDVELPPWAAGSAARFLAQHRAALEAPYVSANLHHWIDLIFGFKQTGEAADAADNVFHPLTYEGAVDLDAETDPRRRRAMEAQINEFGQCPRQLFRKPHPPRLAAPAGEPDPDCDSDS